MNTTSVGGRCLSCKGVLAKNLKEIKKVLAAKEQGTNVYMKTFDCKHCTKRYVSFSHDDYHLLYEK